MREGIALLGVEFLTPGLARRLGSQPPPMDKAFQKFLLRGAISKRAGALEEDHPDRRVLKSLESDLDVALADFEELLKAGFSAGDFEQPALRAVFGDLATAILGRGFSLSSPAEQAQLGSSQPLADRILILATGPELWPDFFGLAALASRCRSACVIVDEPEWAGRLAGGEAWVGLWEKCLGNQAVACDDPASAEGAQSVGSIWISGDGSPERAVVRVGRTLSDEMHAVAAEVGRLLDSGSRSLAVVFPGAGAAHAELVRLLTAQGVVFTDLVGVAAPPPSDVRLQQGTVRLLKAGCALDELLALWPLLLDRGMVRASPAEARRSAERHFDETQCRLLEPSLEALESSSQGCSRELAQAARLFLPSWPSELTLAEGLSRFEAVRERLGLEATAGWANVRAFAASCSEASPADAVLELIGTFLPEKAPSTAPGGHSGFSRVTLTTLRRASAIAWDDVIFVQSNEGIWPQRRESSAWLTDAARKALIGSASLALGLPSADERLDAERRTYAAIARDTSRFVVFGASCADEEDTEVLLEPNGWLERILWKKGLIGPKAGASAVLARLATRVVQPTGELRQPGWLATWNRRRDAAVAFDEEFFGDPAGPRPFSLSAGQIEKGLEDPLVLWFEAVLRVRPTAWLPLSRERAKLVGTCVHRAIGLCLKGHPVSGDFFEMPPRQDARLRLAEQLALLRGRLPAGRYYDSLLMEMRAMAEDLLEQVYSLQPFAFAAVETELPPSTTIAAGAIEGLNVRGRIDLVLSDRPKWQGAQVAIIDYKTGGRAKLSAASMASHGSALQLGVYLLAARSLGAARASVWMLKPGERPASLDLGEAPAATVRLAQLGRHLTSGLYGALSADPGEFSRRAQWPLACAPIAYSVLESKYNLTFGADAAPAGRELSDE